MYRSDNGWTTSNQTLVIIDLKLCNNLFLKCISKALCKRNIFIKNKTFIVVIISFFFFHIKVDMKVEIFVIKVSENCKFLITYMQAKQKIPIGNDLLHKVFSVFTSFLVTFCSKKIPEQ